MKSHLVNLILPICIALIGFNSGLSAQESLNATGGNVSGAGGTVSFSVGQVVYKTFTTSDYSVAQGVQQPYEISVITESENTIGINLSVTAFPNPATDFLILKMVNIDHLACSFQMYDTAGKLLREGWIENAETRIPLTGFSPATYFFKVIKNREEIKRFKIIKM